MSQLPEYISRVEIAKLWNRYDVAWDLNPDVNILSGVNGSGKSTILNAIAEVMGNYHAPEKAGEFLRYIKVQFNDGSSIAASFIAKEEYEKLNLVAQAQWTDPPQWIRENLTYSGPKYVVELERKYKKGSKVVNFDFISAVDNLLKPAEAITKLSDDRVKTDLDWQIYKAQDRYKNYQIDIGKRAFQIVNRKGSNTHDEVASLKKSQERFMAIIDGLFENTGKQINRDTHDISFFSGNQGLSPYQLSAGEKHILLILLTVLVQDNQPSVLFLDEPEVSLHFDWQTKLIEYIHQLNANVQVIIATHSPAVIMEGWTDKAVNVNDLLTADGKNTVQNG